jgi:hypothetical protein
MEKSVKRSSDERAEVIVTNVRKAKTWPTRTKGEGKERRKEQ